MKQFQLTCCSTADLSEAFFEAHQIPYVCFHYMMDGVEYPDDLGQTIPFDQFYQKIADGAQPTTSQVNQQAYEEFWTPMLEAGEDILHVTLSGGLSGSVNSANLARLSLAEKFPGRKIVIIDSLGASSGYGLLVTMLCQLRDQGATLEEAAAWGEENKLRVHHWFFSTDLTSYLRGGRISKSSAVLGTMLHICPLLNMNTEGKLIPREKIRGKKKVIETLVKRMEEHAQNGLDYSGKCYISQSACLEDAEKVKALVEARFPKLDGPVVINSIGTVIGSHTGPGTVALFFLGDDRTL
jgi:DegV family protein with EDD domain